MKHANQNRFMKNRQQATRRVARKHSYTSLEVVKTHGSCAFFLQVSQLVCHEKMHSFMVLLNSIYKRDRGLLQRSTTWHNTKLGASLRLPHTGRRDAYKKIATDQIFPDR
jgi:hypothetical protein